MATSKTLTPTNVTIQIPAFTDKPDQRVNSNCIDKEADAINALSDQIAISGAGLTGGVLPLYAWKFQNILFIQALYVSPSSNIAAGEWITFCTLPQGYEPTTTKYFGGVLTDANGNTYGFRGSVGTNRNIEGKFEKAIATSVSLFGTFIIIT